MRRCKAQARGNWHAGAQQFWKGGEGGPTRLPTQKGGQEISVGCPWGTELPGRIWITKGVPWSTTWTGNEAIAGAVERQAMKAVGVLLGPRDGI